ncbi:MAG: transposase [Alloprevotella sp.]|nr:transposase [Alloprevotella sp.]
MPSRSLSYAKITLFAQVIQKLPKDLIKSLVRKHGTDKHAKGFNTFYKARWNIEIFFRNLKQNFHIKSFVGTSSNAVEIQIWTTLITILLFAVLKRQATYKWHFSNLVASLRLNTFTKIDLYVWINEPFTPPSETENDT